MFSKPTIVSFVWFHVFMVEGRFVSFFFVVVRFGFFIYIYIYLNVFFPILFLPGALPRVLL